MAISLRQLNVFVTVAQEKTITAAAEQLFLSKPAVSMALSDMEKLLGQKLFERVNNRLIINEYGNKLLPLADEILSRSDQIQHIFELSDELSGLLKIGASDTIGNQLAPFLLSDFRHQSGHHNQRLLVSNSQTIADKLLAFELDIGLVEGRFDEHESDEDKLLSISPWLSDEMCIACSPTHPLANEKQLTLYDFEQKDWIVREMGSGTREHFMSRMAPRLNNWKISFELSNTEAIINCAAAGLGLAYLSRHSARHAANGGRIHLLPVPLDLQRQYWLVIHKDKFQTPLLSRFIKFCSQWRVDD
ncbi:LysR family transcriptional regulator [Veronia nyctiphanis]|uniref:LysR family transcriptional regulator n=1 Tax=Veronia nyctiphanis TaxID=1278244 RepID=A0A4Q0YNM2_9GAMM|nr:LysR substrate-binding domain-containing protein [Veronia nyctiphanis]RXJ72542.1 LysR family transcriptional regulator [Veronia nyctiphanis]